MKYGIGGFLLGEVWEAVSGMEMPIYVKHSDNRVKYLAVSSQLSGSCKLQIPWGLYYPSIVPLTFKKFDASWVLNATLKIFTKSHPSVKLETYSDTN